jgi:hypothetical protein
VQNPRPQMPVAGNASSFYFNHLRIFSPVLPPQRVQPLSHDAVGTFDDVRPVEDRRSARHCGALSSQMAAVRFPEHERTADWLVKSVMV